MKKIWRTFFISLETGLFILFLFLAPKVLAADLDVACDDGDCSVSPSGPLFSETNIYPNWTITKTVKGINNYGQEATFAVEVADLTDLSSLGDVLKVTIKKSGDTTNIYDDNLTNFENYGYLPLSDISAGGTQDYDFSVKMQKSADDQYQNLNLSFDLTLGFELSPLPSGPTSTPSPSGECTASAPSSPTNLVASTVSSSVINLTWSAPSETLTHYAVSYGVNPDVYIYGATNVGDVTSYTVSGLSSGTTYYFVVYAVNDCASSGPSNEASATTSGVLGAFVAPGPAAGFVEILGEQKEAAEEGELGGGIATEAGETEGVSVVRKSCFWWLILSILATLMSYLSLKRIKDLKKKHLWISFIWAVLAFLGDRLAHRWFLPSRFCCWMWLWALISFLIGVFVWWRKRS